MREFLFVLFLFINSFTYSQNRKELKELYRAARDTSSINYIVLKSKEKREIKSIKIYKGGRGAGKAVLANGETIKFIPGDIIEYQDDDAFYKIGTFSYHGMDGGASGTSLAKREYRDSINIYYMSITYNRMMTKQYESPIGGAYFYCVEGNNDGDLIQLKNDPDIVNKVEMLVKRSTAAIKIITELKSKYGKWKDTGYVESKLMEAVKVYNADAIEGKLL